MLTLNRKLIPTRRNTALDREKLIVFSELNSLTEKYIENFSEETRLEEHDKLAITTNLQKLYPADIAEFINHLPYDFKEFFVNQIITEIKPKFLLEFKEDFRAKIMLGLDAKTLKLVFSELDVGDDVYILKALSKEEQNKILVNLPKSISEPLFRILSFPKDSIGRVMQTEFVSVTKNWKIGEVLNYIKNSKSSSDYYYLIIVVDNNNAPIATIPISKVIRSKANYTVEDVMEPMRKVFTAFTDKEDVAFYFQKYALVAAPVVNESNELIGVVNINDIVEVIEEESQEDMMRFVGLGQSDINDTAIQKARHRLPWLFINLLTAIMAASIVALFADEINKVVVLAVLMPMIASMSGNAGMQSLAVAVRGFATKELSKANAFRLLRREFISSFLNGIFFGVLVFLVSYFIYGDIKISSIFGFAMFAALSFAGLFGIATPLVLVRLGFDPAVASSVVLTTFTDMSSFFIFLGLAHLLI